ncbi:DNA-3-methyladenine glycosylase [Edaphobacter sp.]|uniref:DNA-3-methyladenine glycosylase n=1 Tax=Edaphobacter sp. TaxID=1934404 RepID=UPI0039C8A1B8
MTATSNEIWISCQPEGVLSRALELVEGLDVMLQLRGSSHLTRPNLLTAGPGRLF